MVTIHDKRQVLYKEMTSDEAKSNVAKWNMIGGVQLKHVKHCLMFIECNDQAYSDWTLDVVIVKKSSPKNLSADCRPTVDRQLADSLPTG